MCPLSLRLKPARADAASSFHGFLVLACRTRSAKYTHTAMQAAPIAVRRYRRVCANRLPIASLALYYRHSLGNSTGGPYPRRRWSARGVKVFDGKLVEEMVFCAGAGMKKGKSRRNPFKRLAAWRAASLKTPVQTTCERARIRDLPVLQFPVDVPQGQYRPRTSRSQTTGRAASRRSSASR